MDLDVEMRALAELQLGLVARRQATTLGALTRHDRPLDLRTRLGPAR